VFQWRDKLKAPWGVKEEKRGRRKSPKKKVGTKQNGFRKGGHGGMLFSRGDRGDGKCLRKGGPAKERMERENGKSSNKNGTSSYGEERIPRELEWEMGVHWKEKKKGGRFSAVDQRKGGEKTKGVCSAMSSIHTEEKMKKGERLG